MQNLTRNALLPVPLCTPLVREGGVIVKLEGVQRTGSVKYRMVYEKVRKAIAGEAIRPTTVLTEASSGSTGIALAYAGFILEMGVEIHTYEHASPEKLRRISDLGAKLILHPKETPMDGILQTMERKARQGGHWLLGQYRRQSNADAYRSFGEELVDQIHHTDFPDPELFVCAVGTGGVMTGVGTVLREAFPGIEIVAVEPEMGTAIDGMRNTEVLNLGENDPFDPRFPDQRYTVPSPGEAALVGSFRIGRSATAVFELVKTIGWKNVVMIAAD